MSQSAFIDNLNKELHKYICRVTIGNSKLLYTKLKRYPITECTNDYISMYNLITDECDHIKKIDITHFEIIDTNIINNIKKETSFIKKNKLLYKKVIDNVISKDLFYGTVLNKTIVDYDISESIGDFDFNLDINILKGVDIPKDKFELLKQSFIKIVKNISDKNKAELQNLKKDCETEEDKEDIDTIMEMFDDCIEEIDFSGVKKLKDLLECWPPLLMPYPESIHKLIDLHITDDEPVFNKIDEFKQIVNTIDDHNIIKEFIEILGKEKNNIPEDMFIEYNKILEDILDVTNIQNEL